MNKIYGRIMLLGCAIYMGGIMQTANAQTYIITTIAGNGVGNYSGDGGPATAAELANPRGVFNDAAGNVYIPDQNNERVRFVNTNGTISTFAGNGTGAFSGDGGPATAAEVFYANDVTSDALGNIYIADDYNFRIRKVNSSGIITTVAGNGSSGFSGDGLQATNAQINQPGSMCFDAAGNMYIADVVNCRIRKVNTSGIISTFAGNGTAGYSGDGGQATAAELAAPSFVTVDASGNVYMSDYNNNRVRVINTSGVISTVAGTGAAGFGGDGGQATAAQINGPAGVAIDPLGNLCFADANNNRIRLVNTNGVITTIAGTGTASFSGDGGPATAAAIRFPNAVKTDASGNFYFADSFNNRIRLLTKNVSGTNEVSTANTQAHIYPNPCTEQTCIDIDAPALVSIFNMIGENLCNYTVQKGHNTINTQSLPNGVYIVKVKTQTGIFTSKLMKVSQ